MIINLEYVSSGNNYIRISNPGAYKLPVNLKFINQIFAKLQQPHHKFSLLYNGYTEKHFGVAFRKYYAKSSHAIYADSGGLQMVTRGLVPTPQLKAEVYESQARDSDIAMSFDEIPIHISGDRSLRLDMKNRFFDPDRFVEAATQTGDNLKEQLEYFEKHKSAAKPLFIAQGNDLETYVRWTEIALARVPRSLHDRIGGVAMGGAALGNAMLEDIKRAFYFSQLPIDHSHLHLLGVGSVVRMLPYLVFCHNGLYDKDIWISYDSSTHTSGPEMGRHYIDRKTIAFGKDLDHGYTLIYEDIQRNFENILDFDVSTLHGALTCGGYVKAQEIYGTTKEAIQSFVVMFAASVMNFMRHVDSAMQDQQSLLAEVDGKVQLGLKNLYAVKTPADFKHWEQQCGPTLPSNAVKLKPTPLF